MPLEVKSNNMAAFDLKTALTLLTVVDTDENQIKQLIDEIEFYKNIIQSEEHQLSIEFILKTRLSSKAKIKLD